MNYQQNVFAMISGLSGSNNKIVVEKSLCRFMGSLEGGVFLSQLLFWCDRGGRTDGWFYKSYREWEEETMLSEYQVRKAAKQCVGMGFLQTEVRKANGAPTVHYKIDQEIFAESILEYFRLETEKFQEPGSANIQEWIPKKLQEPITKITTKITTKTTTDHLSACADDRPDPPSFEDEIEHQPLFSYGNESSTDPVEESDGEDHSGGRVLTPWQEFIGGMCYVCHGHKEVRTLTKEMKGQLVSESKLICDAGFTIDDLRQWWKDVWCKSYKWKNGNTRPNPSIVRSSIAAVRESGQDDWHTSGSPKHSAGGEAVARLFARLEREGVEIGA